MGWIIILVIALAIMAAFIFFWKARRGAWEMVAAALLLGIAGYAWQAHPGMAGSPAKTIAETVVCNPDDLAQRQAMREGFGAGSNWLIMADAQSCRGNYSEAASMLRNAVRENPKNGDLWLELGLSLLNLSKGEMTPAAQLAFQRAANVAPDHPGPPFFMGLSLAQSGRLEDARRLWQQLLDRTPPDAEWRADLVQRLDRINQMIGPEPAPSAKPEL